MVNISFFFFFFLHILRLCGIMTDLLNVFYIQDLAWEVALYPSPLLLSYCYQFLRPLDFTILSSNFNCLSAKPAFPFSVVSPLPFDPPFCHYFSTSNFCIF